MAKKVNRVKFYSVFETDEDFSTAQLLIPAGYRLVTGGHEVVHTGGEGSPGVEYVIQSSRPAVAGIEDGDGWVVSVWNPGLRPLQITIHVIAEAGDQVPALQMEVVPPEV